MKELCTLHYEEQNKAQSCEEILFHGINQNAFEVKGMQPMHPFCISLKTSDRNIVGGINGVTYYGCLYIDMLWIAKELRHQGFGVQLVKAAEKIGLERGCTFSTINTMDWEALHFYEGLGYSIEFIREGYEKQSKMYMLRKGI